ncbi:alpha-1,3-mannosyl-glycoprotein 4-beta-N-acetylglucosaminyltransferase B-like [Octopus vulgaris]|uniref:Alpha-1,3-mannosyl-glycoprotein 4-beta-N-acetylglucosaminyltransferase B-like n=2 Tax=Octopus TaxID=6643 RepID=A0AA36FG56_OCTVU|nr:alpha-1,3-mannosyl-glycoprotein 4-beta-N-acetylglucosaminyltransferase A isoform X2 [Octopus sinensis]CAI9736357.1 alpha-1,3-mannosyl-glycoprotein 4-beta-N-acetylglucosaminyltransferase B-like [Octopus vulgaris]
MRARLKNVVLLLVMVFILPIFFMVTRPDGQYEALLEKRFAELHARLKFAESLNKQRKNDIHILRSQFTYLLQSVLHSNVSNKSVLIEKFPSDLQTALVNFTDLYGQSSIHLPSLFTYLPHLSHNPNGMRPAYKLSRNRFGVSMVFGIPTIKRDRVSYLRRTLHSLIDGLNEEEREDCLIIVFVAEPWNLQYVKQVGDQIYKEFHSSVDSGLLEVISSPPEFYPNLDNLKRTLGDSQDRVRWRTKQNLDFSFLMLYAKSKGVFYAQLEDDVISKPGYFSIMKTFTQQQKYVEWFVLEFSTLGFIGKLFKSSELPILVEFFLMFHTSQPIDWLLDDFLTVKICNPDKDRKHCVRMKEEVRRRYKPSLFQHIGIQSSLKGKIQKLQDKYFGKDGLYRAHINPHAVVSTSLKTYQQFTLQKAYLGETIFWGMSPLPKDMVKFEFTPPVVLESFKFRSGNSEHPGDKFFDTVVEILPVTHEHTKDGTPYPILNHGYYQVARFKADGVAEGTIKDNIGPIKILRLHCQVKSDSWAILSEIYIKAKTS